MLMNLYVVTYCYDTFLFTSGPVPWYFGDALPYPFALSPLVSYLKYISGK
jgi:hypothetical protein